MSAATQVRNPPMRHRDHPVKNRTGAVMCSLIMYVCSAVYSVLFFSILSTLRPYFWRRCRFNRTCQCSPSLIRPSLESSPELLGLKDCASGQSHTWIYTTLCKWPNCTVFPRAPLSGYSLDLENKWVSRGKAGRWNTVGPESWVLLYNVEIR